MLPIPESRSCYANINCNIRLIQPKLKATTAQVISKSYRLLGQFNRYLFLKGNFNFISIPDSLEIVGKGVHTPVPAVFLAIPSDCTCTPPMLHRNRLSGPLLDRIDLHIEVLRVPHKDLTDQIPAESTVSVLTAPEKFSMSALSHLTSTPIVRGNRDTFCPPYPDPFAVIQNHVGRVVVVGGRTGF